MDTEAWILQLAHEGAVGREYSGCLHTWPSDPISGSHGLNLNLMTVRQTTWSNPSRVHVEVERED
jgi:hypothetical protein